MWCNACQMWCNACQMWCNACQKWCNACQKWCNACEIKWCNACPMLVFVLVSWLVRSSDVMQLDPVLWCMSDACLCAGQLTCWSSAALKRDVYTRKKRWLHKEKETYRQEKRRGDWLDVIGWHTNCLDVIGWHTNTWMTHQHKQSQTTKQTQTNTYLEIDLI